MSEDTEGCEVRWQREDTVFWDHKGVMLVDFTPQGTIISAGAYCSALE
jgi:hypothetical protein